MARALPAGHVPRRRAFFGLLDRDGWAWAGLKAFAWFILIIFLLAYVPDRAYYFTVGRTVDLGILVPQLTPVNLCPPENENVPCPVPAGGILPWHPSPPELALPEPRVEGGFVQAGTKLLLIGGGADAQSASDTTFVAQAVGTGNFDRWQPGPPLPEPRRDAGVTFFNGLIYVAGGYDENGAPTDTTFVLQPNLQTGDVGTWQTAAEVEQPIDLPEPRAAAPLVALADGLLLAGGVGPDGQPTGTTWKTTLDPDTGNLGEWVPQAELAQPVADHVAVLNGSHVWVIGGRDASGPTRLVQSAGIAGEESISGRDDPGGSDSSVDREEASGAVGGGDQPDDQPGAGSPAPGAGSPSPGGSPAPGGSPGPGASPAPQPTPSIARWRVPAGGNDAANLPAPRMNAMGLAANGTIYVVGGSDGTGSQGELYWAVPASGAEGDEIGEWHTLPQTDLAEPGLESAAIGTSGPNLFLVGGQSAGTPQVGSIRANGAPQEPFFQAGVAGVVVPALKIEGEIGQQLGYLNAAAAGGAMFALLVVVGYLMAHREQTARLVDRLRRRGR